MHKVTLPPAPPVICVLSGRAGVPVDKRAVASYRASTGRWAARVEWEMTVTEREWLNCTDPRPMLKFLKGRASYRKL
jgi:hypothetical protein